MYTNNITSQLTFSIDIEETSVPSRKKKLTFQPFMEQLLKRRYLPSPEMVVADAGYASEQNYLYSIGEEKEPRFQIKCTLCKGHFKKS